MTKFVIYTDGGSRGNPGHAAASFVILNEKGVSIDQDGIYIGVATNNEAEYRAVILALERLVEKHSKELPAEVEIRADSLLVVNQLSGQFQVKNPRIKVFVDQVKELEKKVGDVSYKHIYRSDNSQADSLVNLALDKHLMS